VTTTLTNPAASTLSLNFVGAESTPTRSTRRSPATSVWPKDLPLSARTTRAPFTPSPLRSAAWSQNRFRSRVVAVPRDARCSPEILNSPGVRFGDTRSTSTGSATEDSCSCIAEFPMPVVGTAHGCHRESPTSVRAITATRARMMTEYNASRRG